MMLGIIFVIFMAILFYFVLKMIYNIVIVVVVVQVFARIKAKGTETLKKYNEQKGENENGEKG